MLLLHHFNKCLNQLLIISLSETLAERLFIISDWIVGNHMHPYVKSYNSCIVMIDMHNSLLFLWTFLLNKTVSYHSSQIS